MWSLVNHVEGGGQTGVTSSGIDTTGANLIVMNVAWGNSLADPTTIADSKGNTWTPLTELDSEWLSDRLYYCYSPIVGAGHTFTANNGSNIYVSIQVLAFSGAGASPFDAQNGATTNASSIQPGSVTPSEDGELIITGLVNGEALTSINGGFTYFESVLVPGVSVGGAIAYFFQTSAAAVNPTWTLAGANPLASPIACFKGDGTGGGGGSVIPVFLNHMKTQGMS